MTIQFKANSNGTADVLVDGQTAGTFSAQGFLATTPVLRSWKVRAIGTERVYGNSYTNNTKYKMCLSWSSVNVGNCTVTLYVDGVAIQTINASSLTISGLFYTELDPGQSYRIVLAAGSPTTPIWAELSV